MARAGTSRPAEVAPHERGRKWRERPHFFGRWCGTEEGKGGQASGHPLPPLRGRSLHSDLWREGQCTPVSLGGLSLSSRRPTGGGELYWEPATPQGQLSDLGFRLRENPCQPLSYDDKL